MVRHHLVCADRVRLFQRSCQAQLEGDSGRAGPVRHALVLRDSQRADICTCGCRRSAGASVQHFTGYALWTVPTGTAFLLLIGVELSLMLGSSM
jgi:hypothetical protein